MNLEYITPIVESGIHDAWKANVGFEIQVDVHVNFMGTKRGVILLTKWIVEFVDGSYVGT